MKLIRTYAMIAILNWILVSAVVVGTPAFRNTKMEPGRPVVSLPTMTPVPTPTQKVTVVHVKRVVVLQPTGQPAVLGQQKAAETSITTTTASTQATEQPASSQPAPTAVSTPDPRCIITIDGAKYDVTQFRFMHSGGNIFTCNADMSAVFWSQHNQSTLSRMAAYRI